MEGAPMTFNPDPVSGKHSYYGIEKINMSTPVFVSRKDGHFYDLQTVNEQAHNAAYTTHTSLMKLDIGRGHEPKILRSRRVLEPGEHEVYLKPLSHDERVKLVGAISEGFIRGTLCRVARVAATIEGGQGERKPPRPIEDIRADLAAKEQFWYDLAPPVPREELKRVQDPLGLAVQILTHGVEYDARILWCFLTTMVEVSLDAAAPHEVQPYAPHAVALTNTKCGKSTLARRLAGEPPMERISEAGLLGFADAEKKVPGRLHNRTKQACCDELQEEKGDGLGKLFSGMETGESNIAKGVGLNSRFACGLTFMGNPRPQASASDYDLARTLREFLGKLSPNYAAVGSRIAWVLYGTEFQEVRSVETVDAIQHKAGEAILRTMAEEYAGIFTVTMKRREVKEWLSKPHSKDYADTVRSIAWEIQDEPIRQFLQGQTSNYRHARGGALRMAWLAKGLRAAIHGEKIPVQDVLEAAEDYYGALCKLNLQSYQAIATSFSSSTTDKIFRQNLTCFSPKYQRLALYALMEHRIANPQYADELVPIGLLAEHYQEAYKAAGILYGHRYSKFANIKESLSSAVDFRALEEFGASYDRGNECFFISAKGLFEKATTTYSQKIKGTNGTTGTKDDDKDEKNNDTNGTNDTKNDENKEKSTVGAISTASSAAKRGVSGSIAQVAIDFLRQGGEHDLDDLLAKYPGLTEEALQNAHKNGEVWLDRGKVKAL